MQLGYGNETGGPVQSTSRCVLPSFAQRKRTIVLSSLIFISIFFIIPRFSFDLSRLSGRLRVSQSRGNDLASGRSRFNFIRPSRSSDQSVPSTEIISNTPGFTCLENIYLRHGIWWIVNDNKTGQVPPLEKIQVGHVPRPNQVDLSPQQMANHIRLVSPTDASEHLGRSAGKVLGTTWVWKENFFIAHYGHMALELLFGSWRISTRAWPNVTPYPDRLILTLVDEREWRDTAGLNLFTLRAAFPWLSFLYRSDFEELKSSSMGLVFDRVVFIDRQAAKLSPLNQQANKMLAELSTLPVKPRVDEWWEPVRTNVVEASEASLNISLPGKIDVHRPVITYISRQSASKRRLREEDHQALVEELADLERRRKDRVECQVVVMENLSAAEQVALAARTTIFISLHGNGLSHQLWAPVVSDQSTTIEILYPQGWARDFELSARLLGRRHYGLWDDILLWGDSMAPEMIIPEGFHGNQIPVKAKAVVKLLEYILDGRPIPNHLSRLI